MLSLKNKLWRLAILFVSPLLFAGCWNSGLSVSSPPASYHEQSLKWTEQVTQGSTTIDLGYRTGGDFEKGKVEPVAYITANGKFVANAMVFHQLVDADGNVVSSELPTVYENDAGEPGGIYKQGVHEVSSKNEAATIQFRIILPGEADAVSAVVEL